MTLTFIAAYVGTFLAIISAAWIISHKSKDQRTRDQIDESVAAQQRADIFVLQRETVRIMRENQVELKAIAAAAALIATK
jgi:hypothetical protein